VSPTNGGTSVTCCLTTSSSSTLAGVIAFVSDSVAELAGYVPNELVGTAIERLVPEGRRAAHVAQRSHYYENPTPRLMSDHHHPLRHRDGGTIEVGIALSPLTVQDATFIVASVTTADAAANPSPTSPIKMAAAALLAERETDYRTAFENTMAPMFFATPDGIITVANDAFARLVGRARFDLVGHSTASFTHPDDLDVANRAAAQLVANQVDAVRYPVRYVHSTGRIVEVDVSRSVVRTSDGSVRRFHCLGP